MSPGDLQHYLARIIESDVKLSVMIWGAPGIGKSQTVSAVAKDHELDLVDLRLSQLAPTDLRGLPVADRKEAISRWYPPEFLPTGGKGILFLDELNMAPPAVQGIAQQLILDRCVGSYTLPDSWFVWAAGNRQEDGAAVFSMPSALQNRFIHLDTEPEFDAFRSWALENEIHEQIIAFLGWRPMLLHKLDRSEPAWPSPRSWAAANQLHRAGLDVTPAVGRAAAQEFATWLTVYEKIPDLDSIISGKGAKIPFPKEASVRYATTLGLAVRSKDSKTITNSFGWLLKEAKPEWLQLFLHSKIDTAAQEGTLGTIASMINTNARVKEFIETYRNFMAQM